MSWKRIRENFILCEIKVNEKIKGAPIKFQQTAEKLTEITVKNLKLFL